MKDYIENLDLNVRAYNYVKRAGINDIPTLESMTDEEIMEIRNMTDEVFAHIKEKLNEYKNNLK